MSDPDKITATVDAGVDLTRSGFAAGVAVMRESVERALNMPGVGLALTITGKSGRREALEELERSVLASFEEHLQGHRTRIIAAVDQEAAGK
ncbi:hypothetical protein SEA_BRYNNIE_48 [Arthrobacter phage Brynnie]|nr:hypothetical protein SEA_BRYNNIE_48 [Arthrobacter phage Brynnie]URM87016.1 hypothetical protein SEA_BASILISK_49 [Arthrobacter phage Basilisk]WNM65720.1 hypothetical protein SEA_VULPECULA_48 [Arthrobacter phage Vulpecula]WNM69496.1 hypothetical protein SEA_RUCHI_48 [Arthrobacter phage Ruchi]